MNEFLFSTYNEWNSHWARFYIAFLGVLPTFLVLFYLLQNRKQQRRKNLKNKNTQKKELPTRPINPMNSLRIWKDFFLLFLLLFPSLAHLLFFFFIPEKHFTVSFEVS